MKNPILDNLSSLKCIHCCANEWKVEPQRLSCKKCGHYYPVMSNGKVATADKFFQEQNWEIISDGFDLFKGNEKPIKINKLGGPHIKDLRKNLGINGLAINLGSGQDNYEGFINMDLGAYDPVHIITEIKKVPLVKNSVELVVSNSVLEHIYEYNTVIDEVSRILAIGG